MPGAVAAAHLVAVRADLTDAVFDQAAPYSLAGFSPAWLHWLLSRLTRTAASKVWSSRSAGTAMVIQSSWGRGTCLLRQRGRGSGTASVRLM